MTPDIKLFMCFHKDFGTVPPLCIPIQCGAAINGKNNDVLTDMDGDDNISVLNEHYCELTAIYYAWKNVKAEYYGFCHYRRFWGFGVKSEYPYLAINKISPTNLGKLLGSAEQINDIVSKCDVCVVKPENMGLSVREHYCQSANCFAADFDLFCELVKSEYPFLSSSVTEYITQNNQYFCNMFIMKKDLFNDYCEMLFKSLSEFDKKKKLHGNFAADRTNGYLSERFLGIYLFWKKNSIKVTEIPRIDIQCSLHKMLGYMLFPPETQRRFRFKRIAKVIKNGIYSRKMF